jgi:hypothetical protein
VVGPSGGERERKAKVVMESVRRIERETDHA